MHLTVCVGIPEEKIVGKTSEEDIRKIVESIVHPYVEGSDDKNKWKMDWYEIGGRWEGAFAVKKETVNESLYPSETGRFAYELFDSYDAICNKGQIGPYVAGETEYIPATGALLKDIDWYAIDKLNYFQMYRFMQIIMDENERNERLEGRVPDGYVIDNNCLYLATDESKTILFKKGETFEEHIQRRDIEFAKAVLPLDAYIDKQGTWHRVDEIAMDRCALSELQEGMETPNDKFSKYLNEEMQEDDYLIVLDCHDAGFLVADFDEQEQDGIPTNNESVITAGDTNRINIFLDDDAMNILGDMELETEVLPKKNTVIEFIDSAPLTAEIDYNGNQAEIRIYVRDEMKTNLNLVSHGVVEGNQVTLNEGDQETVLIAHKIAENVNKILFDEGVLETYSQLNSEEEGILFESDGTEKVKYRVVKGKQRPALLCTSLFAGEQMCRPYSDEIVNQFMLDSLSLDEKLEAAENGDIDSMKAVALAYLKGDDVEENPQKALYWMEKAADSGDIEAQFNVGLFYAKGYGSERDFSKAAYWMKKASENGDVDAERLVEEYNNLADSIEKAKEGDAQAQADLAAGLMKLGGSLEQAGAGADYKESLEWAQKAADQKNGDGIWALALAYEHGRGVEPDVEKAIEWYQKGAELGHAPSQHSLGCFYIRGEIVNADQEKGFNLCMKAAEQGYGLAMKTVGYCYQFGTGIKESMKLAMEWYEKALEVMNDPELEEKVMVFQMLPDLEAELDSESTLPEDDTEALATYMETEELEDISEDNKETKCEENEQINEEIGGDVEEKQDIKQLLEVKLENLNQEFHAQKKKIDDEIAECQKKINDFQVMKKSCGIFLFKEKKEIEQRIKETKDKIAHAESFLENETKAHEEKCKYIQIGIKLLSAQKEEVVEFGRDPLSQGKSPIEWMILDNEDTEILLLSKCALDIRPFYGVKEWLNKEFKKQAFNSTEQKMLLPNGGSSERGGDVFLLFPSEAKTYLKDLKANKTSYLSTKIIEEHKMDMGRGVPKETYERVLNNRLSDASHYWLDGKVEFPGVGKGYANFVSESVDTNKTFVSYIGAGATFGVRPAIVIDVTKML